MICVENKRRLFMGIDVGTYESKGVLIDERCRVLYQASAKHGLDNPQPGWYEHDAEKVWWADVCKISRDLLSQAGGDPADVECVGLSALGCDCVPVDENCTPLCPAILYGIDSRATEEIAYINEYYGERLREVIPRPLVSSSISPKILWLKNHRPEAYQKAYKFLTASSFLTARMSGVYCIDKYLSGGFSPLYKNGEINEKECGLFCRPDQLAKVTRAPDIVGTVTEKASSETGLAVGTKVLTGTGDSGAESFSSGIFTPGSIMIQLGSTVFYVYNSDKKPSKGTVGMGDYLIPGCYCVADGTNNGGTLTRWYRDILFPELLAAEEAGGENAYGEMVKLVKDIPAGSEGLITLPYLAGERAPIQDPEAKGVLFGLASHHTRAHLYKSALEGIGYGIAQYFDLLSENDLPVDKIMAVGGGTKNDVWLQIIADMLGKPVHVPEVSIGASYGDAMLCAKSCGCFDSWQDLGDTIRIAKTVEPIEENHQYYKKMMPLFRRLYELNRDMMHQL